MVEEVRLLSDRKLLFTPALLPRGWRLLADVEREAVLEFCEADSITAEREPCCFLEEEGNMLLWPWLCLLSPSDI
jgi:hypothetical protein